MQNDGRRAAQGWAGFKIVGCNAQIADGRDDGASSAACLAGNFALWFLGARAVQGSFASSIAGRLYFPTHLSALLSPQARLSGRPPLSGAFSPLRLQPSGLHRAAAALKFTTKRSALQVAAAASGSGREAASSGKRRQQRWLSGAKVRMARNKAPSVCARAQIVFRSGGPTGVHFWHQSHSDAFEPRTTAAASLASLHCCCMLRPKCRRSPLDRGAPQRRQERQRLALARGEQDGVDQAAAGRAAHRCRGGRQRRRLGGKGDASQERDRGGERAHSRGRGHLGALRAQPSQSSAKARNLQQHSAEVLPCSAKQSTKEIGRETL